VLVCSLELQSYFELMALRSTQGPMLKASEHGMLLTVWYFKFTYFLINEVLLY